jgi:hypothetical protein
VTVGTLTSTTHSNSGTFSNGGAFSNFGTFCNVGNAFFGSNLTVVGTTVVQNITVSNVETLVQSFSNQGTLSNAGAAFFGGAITATGQTVTAGTVSASSRIGIGPSPCNSPIGIDVSSNLANSCIIVNTYSSNNPGLALINRSGATNYVMNAGGVNSGAVGTNPGDMVITSACNLVLGVDAGNLYLQKTTGYVGIGQNTPTYALDVNGTGSTPLLNLVNSTYNVLSNIGSTLNLQTVKFNPGLGGDARLTTYAKRNNNNNTSNTWYGISTRIEYSIYDSAKKSYIEFNPSNNVQDEDSGLAFGFGNSESMRINRSGNVGIGTTNPQYMLDVNGFARASAVIVNGTVQSRTGTETVTLNQNGAQTPNISFGAYGNTYCNVNMGMAYAGLGTSSCSFGLGIWGSGAMAFNWGGDGSYYPNTHNTQSLGRSAYAWSAVYATNGTIQTSDSNLKTFVPLTYGLKDLLNVSTIKYKWNTQSNLPEDDPAKNYEYYGIIANQIHEIFPELCYNEGSNLQLNYSELIPVQINAIKELAASNLALTAQVQELFTSNAMFASQLQQLLTK